MVRREGGLSGVEEAAGMMIKRNPGVICLWTTRGYEVFNDGRDKPLITIGTAERVTWWREGRSATRDEVEESITSGLPILLAEAKRDGPFAVEELGRGVERTRLLYPPARD